MSNTEFTHLLSPLTIGNLVIRNRSLSTAHVPNFTENNKIGSRLIEYHRARAEGGIGLIIYGTVSVDGTPIGVAASGGLTSTDEAIEQYRELTSAVHEEGAKMFCLLSHSGSVNSMGYNGEPPRAPSPIPMDRARDIPHELEVDEIAAIVRSFGTAAARCKAGGFDGVELSFTHGNLVQQFVSPLTNKRTDEYGGTEEKRLRFAREVLQEVRAAVGDDYILGIRFSATEIVPGGYDLGDGVRYAKLMTEWGKLDFLDVSAGTNNSMKSRSMHYPTISMPAQPLVGYARAIKHAVTIPVFCIGKIADPHEAESILAKGDADMVGMTRAHIAEPAIIRKLMEGREEDIRTCIHGNEGCFARQQRVGDITCVYNPRTGRESKWARLVPTENYRSVMVIGGGPAGLEAARVAAKRGHDVVLCERSNRLGGQVRTLCKTPFRQDYAQIVDWLERQARKSGVLMRLEQEMDADAILKANPDVVIIATGANDTRPDIPGADLPHVATAREFINGRKLGKRVVVGDWDGRHMGMSVAETLAQRGHDVEVVTAAFYVGNDADLMTWRASYDRLLELNVKMTPLHELIAVEEDGVLVRRSDGDIRKIACDGVVLCTKGTAERSLYKALRGKIEHLHAIGDCWAPRQIEQAIYEGSRIAREI